ncbi:hypothetical protein HDA32_000124 [Spinactinospora alkalitolerans]|uniref:Uncharacterized protein n=1 Tax=Spinactinospora alkalitolerans TaxID=687207 RepID=A0A852TS65_9ACTN|nr:hypothetical protein [Spinactinospora alkalitolerans]
MTGRTISVTRSRGGFPVTMRHVACSSTCAAAVAARVAPAVYTDLRPDDRGAGMRAVQSPPRTVIEPLERGGSCAECSRDVPPPPRRPYQTTLELLGA